MGIIPSGPTKCAAMSDGRSELDAIKGRSHSMLHSHNAEIDISDIVGPYAWGILHHAAETFPCPPCAEEGKRLLRFCHDFVNLKTGRPLRYPESYHQVLAMAIKADPKPKPRQSKLMDAEILRLVHHGRHHGK